MRIKKKEQPDPEINVGSFADIAFLLIIFFILTTTFALPYGRGMQIPAGTQDPKERTDKQLTISLKPGQIYFGDRGKPLTLEQLRQRLQDADLPSKPNKERIILLDCTDRVPYEEYFPVAMAVSRAGGVIGMVEETAPSGGAQVKSQERGDLDSPGGEEGA